MDVFPKDKLDFIFSGLLALGDVVEMSMFDLIKRAYDKIEEKQSMRYSFENTE